MDQLMTTGVQMMQLDLLIDKENLCVIRALNTITFDDLHKIICHKLSVPTTVPYTFYLPKANITVRKVTRSYDVSSTSLIAAYVQTADMIYYRIYNSEFHVRFASMGVVDEKVAMQAKLLVTQTKIKSMIKKENIVYRNQLSKKTAQQLYAMCERLYDGGLFQYLHDHQFLMLHIEDMLQPIYVENQDHQFLMYFFPDEKSYRRFFCVLKDTPPHQSMYKYKHATVLRIAKKPIISLPYHRYKDSFIAFLEMQRGWEMDGINEAAASELRIILSVLERMLIRLHNDNPITIHKHELMHVYDLPERNTCRIKIAQEESLILPLIPYEQPHNIENLLEKDMVSTYLEMDYHFVRQPHKGVMYEKRPYLLNVSALGPHIHSHYEHMYNSELDIKNAFLDMMVNIIEEHGRPETILVKDRYVYSILNDLCRKLGIFVRIEPKLLQTEAYYADNERVIYDMELVDKVEHNIKRAVIEQPLQHQYSRKTFKMKGYFN